MRRQFFMFVGHYLSNRPDALKGPEHGDGPDRIGGRQPHPARGARERATRNGLEHQNRSHEEQLTHFHADIEKEERERDGVGGKPDLVQRARETETVEPTSPRMGPVVAPAFYHGNLTTGDTPKRIW